MTSDASRKSKPNYPWAELYDMESRVPGSARSHSGRTGRPPRVYIRRKTSVTLSDDEQAMLEKIVYLIRQAMRPGSVSKSQVHGLAVRLLNHRINSLPEHVENWGQVINVVFEGEG